VILSRMREATWGALVVDVVADVNSASTVVPRATTLYMIDITGKKLAARKDHRAHSY